MATSASFEELPDIVDSPEHSDDDEDAVEELLYGAQMDFISHRNSAAISKLQQATSLGSSAACVTLGNLFFSGIRSVRSTSGVTSPSIHERKSYLHHPNSDHDGLAAATLFYTGLEIELAKPIRPTTPTPNDRPARERSASTSSLASGGSWTDNDSEADDESAEGKYFDLSRTLDLVLGLTDSYRFGVLQPEADDDPTSLWTRGAETAERALAHEEISDSHQAHPSQSSRSQPASLSKTPLIPSHFNAPARGASQSPRRAAPERSFSHPSNAIPSPAPFVPSSFQPSSVHAHHLPPVVKLRHTVQIHLFYLLALQKWPTDKPLAERYWTEILRVAATTGGVVGTREGNEIVQRATQRLHSINSLEQDDAWKLAKRKSRAGSRSSDEVPGATPAFDRAASRQSEDRLAGDALVDIWREKKLARQGATALAAAAGKGKGKAVDYEGDASDAHDDSTFTIRPPAARGISASNLAHFAANLLGTTSKPSSTPSTKPAKFHFASSSDYPSPPESPPDTPVHTPPAREEPEPRFPKPSALPGRLIRRPSTSSFQPPSFTDRLLKRSGSSASVSTLPADFFSAHRSAITANSVPTTATWRASSSPFAHSSLSVENHALPDRPAAPPGWGSGFMTRFSNLRKTSTRAASGLNPFRAEAVTATSSLQDVLLRDDLSAGPGMYWADADEVEGHEEGEEEGEAQPEPPIASGSGTTRAPTPPSPGGSASKPPPKRPALRTGRSFVDPTSSPSRNVSFDCPPTIETTPPTPTKIGYAHRSNGRRIFTAPSNENKAPVDMDPLLLELERKSRVGVKTMCKTCAKRGLNYPACPRCHETFCSRACRISKDGGGDGVRHVCATLTA